MTSSDTAPLERLAAICLALPEATRSSATGQHTAFAVRARTFAYHLVNHHGDGRVALCCKVQRGENAAMVDVDPARFFIPPYIGPRGWVGLDLDAAPIDWREIEELVVNSYLLVAPKRLGAGIARP